MSNAFVDFGVSEINSLWVRVSTPESLLLRAAGFNLCCTFEEAHGFEYGYGAHNYSTNGVFEVEPKRCPGFVYRRSIWLGTTDMSKLDFRSFIDHLSAKYGGNTYHLIAKNCNHFTNDVCMHLTGKPIPGWVNRLAGLGSLCNCLLPESLQVDAVRHIPENQENSEKICTIHQPQSTVEGMPRDVRCIWPRAHAVRALSVQISAEGDSFSVSSSATPDSDNDDPDHYLLTAPNVDVAFVRDKSSTSAN